MKWLATAVAMAVGIIVLLDFFIDLPLLDALGTAFREWTIILTAFALIVGMGNLLRVHTLGILRRNEPGAGHSVVVLLTAAIVLAIGLLFGLTETSPMTWLFNNVYEPLQGAFFALTAFFLATAAYRALRARSMETTLMLLAALVVFLGQTPLVDALSDAKEWVLRVPSEAGVRGILLGVALGTIATALRLLVGMDRPYSE
jgi:hypothetical protein